MKKLTPAACALSLLVTVGASAGTVEDIAKCRSQTDSLAMLTCYDAIVVGEASQPNHLAQPQPQGASPVTLVSSDLRVQQKDWQKQVFNPRVELVPTYKNSSKKTVVAIGLNLTITDAFGDVIIQNADKLDIRILPGKSAKSKSFYFWEDNPFISEEPFDRLYGPVSENTAKVASTVTK